MHTATKIYFFAKIVTITISLFTMEAKTQMLYVKYFAKKGQAYWNRTTKTKQNTHKTRATTATKTNIICKGSFRKIVGKV